MEELALPWRSWAALHRWDRSELTSTAAAAAAALMLHSSARPPRHAFDINRSLTCITTPARHRFHLAQLKADLEKGSSFVEEAARLGATGVLTRLMKHCAGAGLRDAACFGGHVRMLCVSHFDGVS
jgi:hypothetical protein